MTQLVFMFPLQYVVQKYMSPVTNYVSINGACSHVAAKSVHRLWGRGGGGGVGQRVCELWSRGEALAPFGS